MSATELDERFAAACAAARAGGAVAREAFGHAAQSSTRVFKGPQDYVLESDAEVELLLRTHLIAAFPSDSFFGEESGGVSRDLLPVSLFASRGGLADCKAARGWLQYERDGMPAE